MGWPDWALAWHHTIGFGIIGPMPESHVLRSVRGHGRGHYAATSSQQDVLDFSSTMRAKFERAPLDDEQQFLWDSVNAERSKGWASELLTAEQLDVHYPAGWASIPTFCHVQPTGKRRRIDNGRAPLHNAATAYTETTTMCTPFHPALMSVCCVP